MVLKNSLSILVDDNPISRAYIQLLIDENFILDESIYLIKNNLKFLPNKLASKLNYFKNNYYAVKFIKSTKIQEFIKYVENYFRLRNNFIIDMYNFENLYSFSKKLIFIHSKTVNDNLVFKALNTKYIYLNTGKEIYKEILDTNNKFIHIHPAELPFVRGADGSLHMYSLYKSYSATSFFINKKIDTGNIISSYKKDFDEFKFNLIPQFSIEDIYRIWFSFIDPIIRLIEFKNIIKTNKKVIFNKNNTNSVNNNYYSFMSYNEKKNLFFKLFS